MTKLDPIIAVANVEASAAWYAQVFGLRNDHGGAHLATLRDERGEVVICLHPWEAHGHPTMADRSIPPGNGLILYLRTAQWEALLKRVQAMGVKLEETLHINPNAHKKEFSFRDPDGYFLTVTEGHDHEG